MTVVLATSPHLNHAAFQEGVVPLGADPRHVAQTFVPMGLLSIAAAVRDRADVRIRDVNKAINRGTVPLGPQFYEDAATWIADDQPELVGFMTEADSYHHVLRLCDAIKARAPTIRTVLGGPHASAVHRATLEAFPAVDAIVRGEGEVAFGALVDALAGDGDLSRVGSLTYRREDSIVENPMLPLLGDLDDLPWPAYDLIDMEPDDGLFVEVGRGCPFRCTFCVTAPYWQRRHRVKSPERIVQELRFVKERYGRADVNFTHDLFTTNRKWVLAVCRALVADGVGTTWTCSSRTDTIDDEQIEWMARAGCRNIYFGVETGTAEMQARIQKNLDLEQAQDVLRRCAGRGIGLTVGFIAGLPGESARSLKGSLLEGLTALELPETVVHVFGFSPYPGSPQYEDVKSELVFDEHFVDFPLGPDEHRRNCALMRTHADVLPRYSWPSAYDGLDLGTVRAAEEFFPIVNAVPRLVLAIRRCGVDPLALLVAWSRWIHRRNRDRDAPPSGLYRGTIADFLEFLPEHLEQVGLADELLLEQIRWEALKNTLRGAGADGQGAIGGDGGTSRVNPTARTATFRFAPDFASGAAPAPQTFAFYRRRDGEPAIVRLRSGAAAALALADRGAGREQIVSALAAGASVPDADAVAEAIVHELESVQLLTA